MPFLVLCSALPDLLSGWIVFKVARLCRTAQNEARATLMTLRSTLRELAKIAMYMEACRNLHIPGFARSDVLMVDMYALYRWDTPNHPALCASIKPLMGSSFDLYGGRGNDLNDWLAIHHQECFGLRPLEAIQRINNHLRHCAAFQWFVGLLADSSADFLYSPCASTLDSDGVAYPSSSTGPGLVIALRRGSLAIAFCVRYAQTTYLQKIFWPWVATLNMPSR